MRGLRRHACRGLEPPRDYRGLVEEGVDIGLRVEGHQVVDLFAGADEADRQIQFARDGDDDAALRGAVELGEHDAGDARERPENSRACFRPFWPVVASSTSSTSCGAPGMSFAAVRFIFSSSAIRLDLVCRRPAVSTITTST